MNNWLGFSLASHDLQTAEDAASHGLRADDGSFSILDAFNRYPHDWSMVSLDFKGEPSELSMVVDSGVNRADELEPKLEDFLGGQSFSLHDQRMAPTGGEFIFPDSSLPVPPVALSGGCGGGSTGLSVIKAWLRNQPHTTGSVSASSQSLSLSMSTGSRSEQSKSAALPAESSLQRTGKRPWMFWPPCRGSPSRRSDRGLRSTEESRGIGGQEDTRLTCGTTAAGEKGKAAKEGKYISEVMTKRRRQPGLTIWQHSSTGVPRPPQISQLPITRRSWRR
ncbi:hypothetical protein HPP92_004123 [Vanilla planifolia]|uniref:Uncharacterized protein n=1 Tax=Vanilla planifolia TaxID=51239 RepID=A0A835S4Y2_VANPL|nr:hypothetical protein HPP92_004123 [Vanilla planifolia]